MNDKPGEQCAWEINVKPVASEAQLSYFDGVGSRPTLVDRTTNGRVGYMHVPFTAIAGLAVFDKCLAARAGKDAMIIDERYDHGGLIPDFCTGKLARKLLAVVSPREGKDNPWPRLAIYVPKMMIINELAGSGGDCFPWFFQRQKLSRLVGIPRDVPMMDGGSVNAREMVFWSTSQGANGLW